ncbi:NAD(P)/FAD-dependent oxidoreductase [Streptomyces sp. NPDC017056]|uniref:NAD(P)/FAD-dependent oxidoreductase n=1 Tax=Streptomyces sp. NPDC017056 TaxID=3364973 RepID=UPI0037998DB6
MTDPVASADVAVVGGGIVGLITAERLTAQGRSVVLVDRAGIAGGATGASGGLIRALDLSGEDGTWAAEGLEVYLRGGWRGSWPEVHEHGSLTLVDGDPTPSMAARIDAVRAAGHCVQPLTAQETATRFPGLAVPDGFTGLYEPRGGWLPAKEVAQAVLRDAGPHLRVLRADATAVLTTGTRVTGVATGAGTVRARAVLLAAGAGSSRLAATVGVALPLRTRAVGYCLFDPGPGPGAADLPTVVDSATGAWLRRWGRGTTVLAGVRSAETDVPEHVRAGVPDREEERVRSVVRHRCPRLAWAPGVGGVTAYDAQAAGGGGSVTAWPEPRGLVTATGWDGGGFKLAPAIGRRAARCLREVITG